MRFSIISWRYFLALIPLIPGCLLLIRFPDSLTPHSLHAKKSPTVIQTSGILDRFLPNNFAVILLEDLNLQLVVPNAQLPDGIKESTYVIISLTDDGYEIESIDEDKTHTTEEVSKDLINQLRSRSVRK